MKEKLFSFIAFLSLLFASQMMKKTAQTFYQTSEKEKKKEKLLLYILSLSLPLDLLRIIHTQKNNNSNTHRTVFSIIITTTIISESIIKYLRWIQVSEG